VVTVLKNVSELSPIFCASFGDVYSTLVGDVSRCAGVIGGFSGVLGGLVLDVGPVVIGSVVIGPEDELLDGSVGICSSLEGLAAAFCG
jgi:hypothetical protein